MFFSTHVRVHSLWVLHCMFLVQLYLKYYLNYDRVLVGTGRACFETLRPLAYSLLAELVHHVRGDLSLSQVFPL